MIKLNFFERVIALFSPSAALRRAQSRAALTAFRGYEAATYGRRTAGMYGGGTSANQELEKALPVLRNRSRELARNNPYAERAMTTIANNVVGHGIKPTPTNSDPDLIAAWKLFVEDADFNGESSLYRMQWLVMRSVAESGEVLVRKRVEASEQFPFKLQVLEPDFIDIEKNYIAPDADGSMVILGVKYDRNGKKLGYWLYNRHPSEFAEYSSSFVPAAEVLHIKQVKRPGQVRGVPFIAPSMTRMHNFDSYEDAELTRQQIASCFSVFVTDSDQPLAAGDDTDRLESVQPGIVEYLPPGKSVEFATPPPSTGYDKYARQVLSGIAVGIGVTYEQISGDLSNVNYTSGRMGWLEFAGNVEQWQSMMVDLFCKPVWRWFLEGLEMKSTAIKTKVDGRYISASWTFPQRRMINPSEEVKAQNEMVRGLYKSWQDAVREFGNDPELILDQMKAYKADTDAAGLKPTSNPEYDSNRPIKQ